MIPTRAFAAAIGLAVCTTTLVAGAHHGWSGYDANRVLKLSGTIEDSSYGNPHGMAKIKTAEKTWNVVLAPASRMEARGLTREMIKVGNQVSVEGYPHTSEADELRAERISVDGKTIELR